MIYREEMVTVESATNRLCRSVKSIGPPLPNRYNILIIVQQAMTNPIRRCDSNCLIKRSRLVRLITIIFNYPIRQTNVKDMPQIDNR